jgi:hypothetical protein
MGRDHADVLLHGWRKAVLRAKAWQDA